MKSDVIAITNKGEGFDRAREEVRKVAVYKDLSEKDILHLQLLAEEMLSTAGMVSGNLSASFWIECENRTFDLHMTTHTILDGQKRAQLIAASTSRKNEAAHSLLGKIRDAFEAAMASERAPEEAPYEVYSDLVGRNIEDPEWDQYECSILRRLADNVKVSIRKNVVDMTVRKVFAD